MSYRRRDTRGTRRRQPEAWQTIRLRIWDRDNGQCDVCGRFTGVNNFTCGHRIDRSAGGCDEDFNLSVFCRRCEELKPRHSSIGQYLDWRRAIRPKVAGRHGR